MSSPHTKPGRDLRPGDGIVVLGAIRQVARIKPIAHPRVPTGGSIAHFHTGEPLVVDPDYHYELWG
jgi:hypothetical protein